MSRGLGDVYKRQEQSDPVADQRGPVEFKKYVAGIVINKALKRAFERS